MSTSNINEQVKNLINEREQDCKARYLNKMEKLDNVDYLRNENIVREKEAKNHIMYKMVIDEKTYLEIDGRKYEFLIEFDKKDYSYGIYYGCKCILDESKDILEQIKTCEDEWWGLREEVNSYLKLTFDIDFEKRENVSNNANDNTYWPFWYRLGDDEDIKVVAALAIKIISNVYRYVLIEKQELEKPSVKTGAERKIEIKSRYDEKSYDDLIKKQRPDIGKLLEELEKDHYLIKHPILEKCWMINKDKIEIGYFMYVMSIYLNKESILDKWAEDVVRRYCRNKEFEGLKNKINNGEKNKLQYLLIYNGVLKCIYENGEENGKERSEKDIKEQYEDLDLQTLAEGCLLGRIQERDEKNIKKTIKDILKLELKVKDFFKKETIDVTKLGVSSIDVLIDQLLDSNDMLKSKTKWKNLVYFLISHSGTPVDRHLPKEVDREKVKQIMKVVIDVIVHVENEKTEREKEENKVEMFFVKIVDALSPK